MLASSLIAGGMNWKQALFTILMGNLIVLVPMLLNAHAGAKYGIPFPVFVRASFGALGANIPAMLRALVACGWFGIQSWLGGQAIAAMIHVVWPATAQHARRPMVELSRLLAAQYVRRLVWRGVDPLSCRVSPRPSCWSCRSPCSSGCCIRQAALDPCFLRPAASTRPAAFSISSFHR